MLLLCNLPCLCFVIAMFLHLALSCSSPALQKDTTFPHAQNVREAEQDSKTWCVARYGTDGISLQAALEWACGEGGADCAPIQPGGFCYAPNTLFAHASYAFNAYYQAAMEAPQSCDFRGAAMLIYVDPSEFCFLLPSSYASINVCFINLCFILSSNSCEVFLCSYALIFPLIYVGPK